MRIGALDLGSNSFHLLVVEAHPDGRFETLVQDKEMLRLGDVVSREGRIPDMVAEQLVASVRRLRSLADAAGAEEFVACATSAMREAENSSAIVDRIEASTGVRVEVISGQEEARLIFAAVRSSVLLEPGPALCLDLGGGSLEIMVGDQNELLWSTSVKLGVARLSTELVRHDPLEQEDVRRLRRRVTQVLAPLAAEVAELHPKMMIGTSGTFCDLARMAAARTGSVPESINQLTVRRKELAVVHDRLLALPAAARTRLPGLEAKRADIVPAGSVVLMTAMELFGFDRFTVGEWALREGIVLDAIGHHDPADWSGEPRAIRRASVLALAQRCGSGEEDVHARQVARLATTLFDETASLHGLRPADRELLGYAGLLHDIGEHVSVESHHKHTAYLIQHGRLRGFSPDEVNMLASLGRFHRRGDPKTSFEPFAALDTDGRTRVTALTALLRLADGLDHGHAGNVERIEVAIEPEVVRLTVWAAADAELELWGLRRKRELFESVFKRRLEAVAPEREALTANG
jgi:exopolyphosphatase/guanosine-5'-triphosphate,3'-diphosphate pyrophosphatase